MADYIHCPQYGTVIKISNDQTQYTKLCDFCWREYLFCWSIYFVDQWLELQTSHQDYVRHQQKKESTE